VSSSRQKRGSLVIVKEFEGSSRVGRVLGRGRAAVAITGGVCLLLSIQGKQQSSVYRKGHE
jgi:hypothetical protein